MGGKQTTDWNILCANRSRISNPFTFPLEKINNSNLLEKYIWNCLTWIVYFFVDPPSPTPKSQPFNSGYVNCTLPTQKSLCVWSSAMNSKKKKCLFLYFNMIQKCRGGVSLCIKCCKILGKGLTEIAPTVLQQSIIKYIWSEQCVLVSYSHMNSLFPYLHRLQFLAVVTGLLCDKTAICGIPSFRRENFLPSPVPRLAAVRDPPN